MFPYGPPFQFIYMRELNFGQTILYNFELLLGTSWGTFCEFDGKPMGPRNVFLKSLPSLPPKERNWMPHECMLNLLIGYMKFLFFQNYLSPFLA
jgi:hypothetical protein